jgi:hypothetical protein
VAVSTQVSGARTHEEGAAQAGARAVGRAPDVVPRRPDPRWVDAGPFRAHLKHLMSVGSLSVPEVAAVLGVSTRAVRHLLEGRSGRLPRRISPQTARRLLLVRAADVRGLRWCITPAGPPARERLVH